MKKLYLFIGAVAFIFILSGCTHDTGFKKLDFDPEPIVNEEDSVVNELTPIITIGDDVGVAVYRCTTSTDCNRCQDGGVYGQVCTNGTCQGDLELIENCKDECSAGQCVDKDEFTAEESEFLIGEDYDLYPKKGEDDDAIVDNDDLLPDGTQCANKIENCIGYRGQGSIYLSDYPACECKFIYVPAGCSPLDPPCSDFSSKTDYPDCACK